MNQRPIVVTGIATSERFAKFYGFADRETVSSCRYELHSHCRTHL